METQTQILPIKTLADFKRMLQVGTKVGCLYHQEIVKDSEGKTSYTTIERPVREVSIKQTNSFALRTQKTTGEVVDSWCHYPSAKSCKIQDGKITIYEQDRTGTEVPILTYWIVA